MILKMYHNLQADISHFAYCRSSKSNWRLSKLDKKYTDFESLDQDRPLLLSHQHRYLGIDCCSIHTLGFEGTHIHLESYRFCRHRHYYKEHMFVGPIHTNLVWDSHRKILIGEWKHPMFVSDYSQVYMIDPTICTFELIDTDNHSNSARYWLS